jgi:ABC-type Fe3+ transport system substrate-binding protein
MMTDTAILSRLVALAIFLSVPIWLCSPAAAEMERTPALDALIKAAEAEGTLNVVWANNSMGGPAGAAALQDAINREFHMHIKIAFTPGPSMPQMSTRITQEAKAGQTASSDAFLGVSVNFPTMIAAHVLEQVPWSSLNPAIKPEMRTADGEAVLVYTLFETFTYNATLVPRDQVPHNFAGLFRPEWKGKLASTPYAAGFDELALQEGDEKIRPIVERLAEWAGGLIRCGDYGRIASGEFIGLAIDCGQVAPEFMAENGGPVDASLLDDGLGTELTYLSVPKTSAHPNLAKFFIAFIMTPEGQKILDKYEHATSHVYPGTPAYERAQSLAKRGLKLVVWTPDAIAPQMEKAERLKKEYERILEKK